MQNEVQKIPFIPITQTPVGITRKPFPLFLSLYNILHYLTMLILSIRTTKPPHRSKQRKGGKE